MRIFDYKKLIEQKLFFEKFDLVCHLNRYDSIIIIRILLNLKLLKKEKILINKKLIIFYTILNKNEK